MMPSDFIFVRTLHFSFIHTSRGEFATLEWCWVKSVGRDLHVYLGRDWPTKGNFVRINILRDIREFNFAEPV